jgi:Cft2 family RNA processing exonuclease
VLLTHFHLDHSGALPLLTERHGYRGPLLMTAPTRALTPVILSDYWRLHVERRGVPESEFYSRAEIESCFQRVRCVQVHEEVRVNSRLSVQTHYAGHVLGAAMFLIRIDAEPECIRQPSLPTSQAADRTICIDSSPALARAPLYILYSGDINHCADMHLGAFSLHRLPPSLHPHSAYGAVSASAFQRATSMGFAQALQPNPQLPPHLQSLNSLSVLITESTYVLSCLFHSVCISSMSYAASLTSDTVARFAIVR